MTKKNQNVDAESMHNTDYEVQSLDHAETKQEEKANSPIHKLNYFVAGLTFGVLLVKSEVISWFRIQEMFRFESFHMYGVMGSALIVGMTSVFIIKRMKLKTINGEPITFQSRKFSKGTIFGGLLFGCGWALTGACPGPLFAQIGSGSLAVIVTLLSAIAGTWVYGAWSNKLPH